MSLGTSNRDGGKTSESGHLRALAKLVSGDVIEGLAVSQRGAGANMSVDVAIGDAFVRRSDGSYAHPVFNDAVYNQVIAAADGSNPRRDLIVLYVDYGQAPSTAVSNNTNGVVKIKVVNGSPAGSPVDPNAAAIQASVGAGNPYTILGRVRVPAGQTSITNTLIDDLRVLIYAKANSVPTSALQDGSVTPAKSGFTKSTDANGWVVFDYGTFKKYMRDDLQCTIAPNGYASTSPVNLPVGTTSANLRATNSIWSGGAGQVAYSVVYPSSTTLQVDTHSFAGASLTPKFCVELTTR